MHDASDSDDTLVPGALSSVAPVGEAKPLSLRELNEGYASGRLLRFSWFYWLACFRSAPQFDQRGLDADLRANGALLVKPLWVTFGCGLTGLALFAGSIWLADLNAMLGSPLGSYVWLGRLACMLIGGFLIIIAWPVPVQLDKSSRQPDDSLPPPLKTRR